MELVVLTCSYFGYLVQAQSKAVSGGDGLTGRLLEVCPPGELSVCAAYLCGSCRV